MPPGASAVSGNGGWRMIFDTHPGAWQQDAPPSVDATLRNSAVYACVDLISNDIAKIPIRLMRRKAGRYWETLSGDRRSMVLRKPNRTQIRLQFIQQWLVSKLLHGNTYVLKERDGNGIVRAMSVLDPTRVTPLITESGDVYYQIANDDVRRDLADGVVVPALDIIHDRGAALYHPLVGVSPIHACATSAALGSQIQGMGSKFFQNMARPSGILLAPNKVSDVTARDLAKRWNEGFGGDKSGRVAVLGDAMTYQPLTMPATDAQLIEQLGWTVQDIGRAFHVPLHKISSGANPTFNNVAAMNADYYAQCLQIYIEAIEGLMDDAFGLSEDEGVVFDLSQLIRTDPVTRAEVATRYIGAGVVAPDEARADIDLPPVAGGDTPYLQMQNYSLAALANRDANDPFAKPAQVAPAVDPDPTASEEQKAINAEFEAMRICNGFMCAAAQDSGRGVFAERIKERLL